VDTYVAARDELTSPPLALWLWEIDRSREPEVGGKAAALGEIKNRLSLPVPDGYVLTAEAYRQLCGIPLWQQLRDATRNLDLNDLDTLEKVSVQLADAPRTMPVPRAIEVAITERARTLAVAGAGLACDQAPWAKAEPERLPANLSACSMSPSLRWFKHIGKSWQAASVKELCFIVCPRACLRLKVRWLYCSCS
jgi:hypothetical protein